MIEFSVWLILRLMPEGTRAQISKKLKSMNVFKCNPLWGFKDMGCRQHFCKTPRVILFKVCTMDLKVFWSVQKNSL